MAKLLKEKEEMDTKIAAYRKQEITSDRVRSDFQKVSE